MAGEADRTLTAADMPTIDEGRNDSGAESDALTTSSSVTLATIKMADNKVPEMSDYWKKSTIIEADRQAYLDFGWLTGDCWRSLPNNRPWDPAGIPGFHPRIHLNNNAGKLSRLMVATRKYKGNL
jgi:hypothetical protein